MNMDEELGTNLKVCKGPLCRKNGEGTKKDKSNFAKCGSWCKDCYRHHYLYGGGKEALKKYNDSSKVKAYKKNKYLLQTYCISLSDYENMVKKQDSRCAICDEGVDKDSNGDLSPLCVDHDHSCCPTRICCGRCIRGLLCDRCNKLLGSIKEDTKILENAIYYLNFHKSKKKLKIS